MLETRKSALLQAVIRAYAPDAEPVASEKIVREYHIDCSPATIRNEMVELEKLGYLTQPHTSSGRVPTEKAYRWYVQEVRDERVPTKSEQQCLENVADEKDNLTEALTLLANLCQRAVIFSSDGSSTIFVGMRNLFSQKEMKDKSMREHIGNALDNAQNVMLKEFSPASEEVQFAIGSDNPFDDRCASVFSELRVQGVPGIVVVLSPLRMDYAACTGYLKFLKSLTD